MFVIFYHGLRVVSTAIGRSQYDCLLFYFDLRVNFKLCIDGPRRNTVRQKELKKSRGRKVLPRLQRHGFENCFDNDPDFFNGRGYTMSLIL